MSHEQLADAKRIQAEHRLNPVKDDSVKTERYVANKIHTTSIKNKE